MAERPSSAGKTRCWVLTPPAPGAVAVVRIEGPQAAAVVEQVFRHVGRVRVARMRQDGVYFGHLLQVPGEEVVVCRPGPQTLEIHCHGGPQVVQALLEALAAQGASPAPWSAWLEQKAEPLPVRTALYLLGQAATEKVARLLWHQAHLAWPRWLEQAGAVLRRGELAELERLLREVLAWEDFARHLIEPYQVVLAGRPNVGKSTLLNALLGFQRAVVHPAAGTTRDLVQQTTAWDGLPIRLSDTAGYRVTDEPLEREGIRLAARCWAEANLVLAVLDRSRPWEEEDARFLRAVGQHNSQVLVVLNKCDLPPGGGHPSAVEVSAQTGHGLQRLQQEALARLVPRWPKLQQPLPLDAPLAQLLRQLLRAVTQRDTTQVARLWSQLAKPQQPEEKRPE